ncbi:MAG: hypothetical protein EAZ85_11960 [Bacteroidetes bacterium]|nr:MAG: hypothetical protein EAZ85_11960 [Bacteroidota bacterium]TAG93495.1 MAG: hypothetical protein EAZ20_01620 [Bacteroidota bacterium]
MNTKEKINFEWSPIWWFLFVGGGIIFLLVLGFTSILSSDFWKGIAQGGLVGIFIIHIFEGFYGYLTAKKNNLPAFRWAIHCFLAGAMAIILMKKYIK